MAEPNQRPEASQSFDAGRMAREQERRMAASASIGLNVAQPFIEFQTSMLRLLADRKSFEAVSNIVLMPNLLTGRCETVRSRINRRLGARTFLASVRLPPASFCSAWNIISGSLLTTHRLTMSKGQSRKPQPPHEPDLINECAACEGRGSLMTSKQVQVLRRGADHLQ
jgi:hypothetical protein